MPSVPSAMKFKCKCISAWITSFNTEANFSANYTYISSSMFNRVLVWLIRVVHIECGGGFVFLQAGHSGPFSELNATCHHQQSPSPSQHLGQCQQLHLPLQGSVQKLSSQLRLWFIDDHMSLAMHFSVKAFVNSIWRTKASMCIPRKNFCIMQISNWPGHLSPSC